MSFRPDDTLSPLKRAYLAIEQLEAKLESVSAEHHAPIAIVGAGLRLPGGANDLESYWRLLADGVDAVTPIPPDRWDIDAYYDPDPDSPGKVASRYAGFVKDVDQFDPLFFGISPREAERMDPQQRLLLETSWEALERAGISADALDGSRTGVFIGIATNDYALMQREELGVEGFDQYYASGYAHSIAAGRLSYLLGLQGPSIAVDTACSSSLVAIHLAVQSLRTGDCHMALAGGVNLMLSVETSIALSRLRMLAPDGKCKAFDAAADGFVRSEGCGVVVLKRLSDALADGDPILAVIRGSAINQDGRSNGLTAPNGPSQEAVLRAALADARLTPDALHYVEAHGTGTALGDPIEAQALGAVLGERGEAGPLLVGSVKTNLGHLEAAAGIAGLLKVVLMLGHGQIPASLHFATPSPHIPWERLPITVPTTLQPWPEGVEHRIAGVSSFGFSGTNVHIILEAAPVREESARPEPRSLELLPLSAHSPAALVDLASRYATHLEAHRDLRLADVAATLGQGRAHHAERLALTASTTAEAAATLTQVAAGDVPTGVVRGRAASEAPGVVFLFTGQGSQYAGMGQTLYDEAPVFRAAIDRCAAILAPLLDHGLLEVLFAEPGSREAALLDETHYTQPVLFAVEYALAALWQSWGVRPVAVAGHSLGEYVAACVAGVMSLEDGLKLVAARGRLMGSLPAGGAMAAVFASEARVREVIEQFSDQVSIAAVNGPSHTVISGSADAVESATQEMTAAGVKVRRLTVSHAFHSHLMEPILDDLRSLLTGIELRPPTVRIFNNVTGAGVTKEFADPEYWIKQARNAVQFEAAVEAMLDRDYGLFLEIGPHPVLSGMGSECLGAGAATWLPSMRRGRDDWATILNTLGQMYVAGVEIDWKAVTAGAAAGRAPMPTYPFQRQRYWVQAARRSSARETRPQDVVHPLLGARLRSALRETQFEIEISADDFNFLADHQVFGRTILPAAAFVEAAMAAAAYQQLQMTDLVIQAPLAFTGEERRVLQTIITPDEGHPELRFLSRGLDDEDWILHVSARLGQPASSSTSTVLDLDEVRDRCAVEIDPVDHYRRLADYGIELGPSLQGVQSLRCGTDEALAEIRLAENEAAESGAYGIHPAMLDAAFQSLAAAVPETSGAYMPIALESARLLRSPDSVVWCHARLRQPFAAGSNGLRETLTADLSILDGTGRSLMEISGLALKRAEQSLEQPLDRLFYEVAWHQTSERGPQPEPAILTQRAATVLAAQPDRREDLVRYGELNVDLDALSCGYIVAAFDQLGWRPQVGERVDVDELATCLSVTGRNHRLLGRLLAILSEEGYLTSDPDGLVVQREVAVSDLESLESRRTALIETNPDFQAELALLGRCGPRLAEVLQGHTDPLHLLFPDGDASDAEALYTSSPVARSFNEMVCAAISEVRDASPDRQLRILEIGGGTGGTTTHLLPVLPADRTEYDFTDISPAFTTRAAEKFKEFAFASFKPLDIERDPEAQGFGSAPYDVILAVNVLHAVRDLHQALEHIRWLIAPGGIVVLVEVTAPYRWVDLTFGLTDGWWHFSDTDVRPDYPLINSERWLALLAEQGLEADAVDTGDPSPVNQSLLIARAPVEPAGSMPGEWLIYADEGGVGIELASMLSERGGQPIIARRGADYLPGDGETLLDPLAADGFVRLMREKVSDPRQLAGIVYLWGLDAAPADTLDDLEHAEVLAGAGAMHAVQAALAVDSGARVWLATRGSQAAGGDAVSAPEQAPIWGLGKAIAMEHPELQPVRIDLDTGDEHPATALLREMLESDGEQEVAWRGSNRFVARLSRLDLGLANDRADDDQPVELGIDTRGRLDALMLRPLQRLDPGPGEVEIRVCSAGLNFKDVMNVLGMYPGDPGPLGGECAGTIARVGPGVTGFKPGDEVMALAGGSFRSYITTGAEFVVPRPRTLEPAQAATTAIAYVTASVALEHLGQMQPGERVLIHAAAGGVGMAAVQLALAAGAEVFATAGSPEKHDFLRNLGVTHIYSSRTLDFADEILTETDGEGVDLVLNSLSGDFVRTSLGLLRQNGRFLELGKRDHLEADEIASLGRDIEYHIIDWSETARDDPALIASILSDVVGRVERGLLPSLPVRMFPIEEATDAFQFMARARHIGKIAITFPAPVEDQPVRATGFYLITGGLRGLGLEVARRLAERGARHLLLMGRGEPSPESMETIASLEGEGVHVLIHQGDVSCDADIAAALERIDATERPLLGVFHCAGVLDDAALTQQSWERFRHVFAPKIDGAWLLHELTRCRPLDHFVMFSSIAAVLGAPGQANHSAANAYLDALAAHRRAAGLPGLSINWGAWSQVGAAAGQAVADWARQQGLDALTPGTGLDALEALMAQDLSRAVVAAVRWPVFLKRFSPPPAFYSELAPSISVSETRPSTASRTAGGLRETIAAASPNRRREMVLDFVQAQSGAVLGLDVSMVGPQTPLSDYGLDSLMAVELRNRLGQELELSQPLPATLVFDYPTVEAIADYLAVTVLDLDDAPAETNGAHNGATSSGDENLVSTLLDDLESLSDDEIDLLLADRASQRR